MQEWLNCVWLLATIWTAAGQASPSSTLSRNLLSHVCWVGDDIQPTHSLLPPFPLALNLSQHHSLFQWVSSLHQVAKDWSFSFNISSSNEYSVLILCRVDWFDSQESSPAPQFESINSSVLSLLYGPTLISIHDYLKNYSFDY